MIIQDFVVSLASPKILRLGKKRIKFFVLLSTFRIFAHDDNTDHRIIGSTAGYHARLRLRVLHEGRDVGAAPEIVIGLRLRGDGGCIGVVATDSCDGDGGKQWRLVGAACSSRIPVGYGLSFTDR